MEREGLKDMYDIKQLVTVARREKNNKRSYLYVNPSQGKHIPVDPGIPLKLFQKMGNMLDEKYKNEKIMIVGFAETATAIGTGVALYSHNVKYFSQTTREMYDNKTYLFFTESHSHAMEQGLIIDGYDEIMPDVERVIFVEDEVTTGNTICKLISKIENKFGKYHIKYGIISILNSMSKERIVELEKQEICCQYIKKIPFEYGIGTIDKYEYIDNEVKTKKYIKNQKEIEVTCFENEIVDSRGIISKQKYADFLDEYTENVIKKIHFDLSEQKILVLGTEEYMFIPMMTAKKMEEKNPNWIIKFHATTRSPIMVSEDKKYPLNNRILINSFYEKSRKNYLYNLERYDMCIIMSDSEIVKEKYGDLVNSLYEYGCEKFLIFGKEKHEEQL